MELLKSLRDLARCKASQHKAWKNAQGLSTPGYDDLITQINDLEYGDLDIKIVKLSNIGDNSIPQYIKEMLLERIKKNAELVDAQETISYKIFQNTDIIYCPSKPPSTLSLEGTFKNCQSLIAVGPLDLPDATATPEMFLNDIMLMAVEFTDGSLSKVTNAKSMFRGCTSLQTLTLPAGSFGSVTSAGHMFRGCTSLQTLTLPAGSFGSVTSAGDMFSGCTSLQTLTLPAGSFGSVTSAGHMFRGCTSLTSLDLPDGCFASVTNMIQTVKGCSSLTGSFIHPETTALRNISSMFRDCVKLEHIELYTGSLDSIETLWGQDYDFYNCSSLLTLKLLGGTPLKTSFYCEFYNCKSLTDIEGLDMSSVILSTSDERFPTSVLDSFKTSWYANAVTNTFVYCTSLVNCKLYGTLYKSGVNLRPCISLSAESLYTWVVALYDWETNEEGKVTDDTSHMLYMSTAQQERLRAYTGPDGESGDEAFLAAMAKGWDITA